MVGEFGGDTYETNEDLVAWLDGDFTALILHSVAALGFAVGAEDSVDTDSFHAVAEELLIGFFRVLLGEAVDLREVLLAILGSVVVDDLRELSGMLA